MQQVRNALSAFMEKFKNPGKPGSERTHARKERDKRNIHPLNSRNYATDIHGAVRRLFEKSAPKKVRAKAKRLAKRKALAEV